MSLQKFIESAVDGWETPTARDLKLNFGKLTGPGASLEPRESALACLAAATSVQHTGLAAAARDTLRELGVSPEEAQEAEDAASLVAMLNTYYRFRHYVKAEEAYSSAGLRMTALAKPLVGKVSFEVLAFTVSVLNGCEMCVVSHEKALRSHGVSTEKIHDLARLAAVVKALSVRFHSR